MEAENRRFHHELSRFYREIKRDGRISPRHIAVFMALFESWSENEFHNPVHLTRKEIMESAKISGLGTYHHCMKELQEYGYITYHPSFHAAVKNKVYVFATSPSDPFT